MAVDTTITSYLQSVTDFGTGAQDREQLLDQLTAVVNRENHFRKLFAQHRDHADLQDPHLLMIPLYEQDPAALTVRDLDEASVPGPGPGTEPAFRMMFQDTPEQRGFRKAAGQLAVAPTLEAFHQNWNLFTEESLRYVNWDNVVAAGGSVLACLAPLFDPESASGQLMAEDADVGFGQVARAEVDKQNDSSTSTLTGANPTPPGEAITPKRQRYIYHHLLYRSSDIDLFIYGLDEEAGRAKLVELYEAISNAIPHAALVFRSKYAVSIVSQFPYRHIQIVLRRYASPAEVLMGFDVDCSGVAFDGRQVYAVPRAHAALVFQRNTIDMSRRSPSYETRLSKYAARGFAVRAPYYDLDRVDPQILERSFAQTQGLARLILLERLRLPAAIQHYRDEQRLRRMRNDSKDALGTESTVAGRAGGHLRRQIEYKLSNDAFLRDRLLGADVTEMSDYATVFLPWGPNWTASSVQRLMREKDQMLNSPWFDRTKSYHTHPCFVGRMSAVLRDCCGFCPPFPADFDVEESSFVHGPLRFIADDPGRQSIGSFRPITDGDWLEPAFLKESTNLLAMAATSGDLGLVQQAMDIESERVVRERQELTSAREAALQAVADAQAAVAALEQQAGTGPGASAAAAAAAAAAEAAAATAAAAAPSVEDDQAAAAAAEVAATKAAAAAAKAASATSFDNDDLIEWIDLAGEAADLAAESAAVAALAAGSSLEAAAAAAASGQPAEPAPLVEARARLAAATADLDQLTQRLDDLVGLRLDARDSLGRTPLILAVLANQRPVVQLLLATGLRALRASVLRLRHGDAAAGGLTEAEAALLAELDPCLVLRIPELVQPSLSERAFNGRTPLHFAAHYDRPEILADLLEYNREVYLLLQEARRIREELALPPVDTEPAEAAVAAATAAASGADSNSDDDGGDDDDDDDDDDDGDDEDYESAEEDADSDADSDADIQLLANMESDDEDGDTAVGSKSRRMLVPAGALADRKARLLVREPFVAVDCEDWDGHLAPLHYAILFGHVACVRLLLEHGASPSRPCLALRDNDRDGLTPLMLVAFIEDTATAVAIARLLVAPPGDLAPGALARVLPAEQAATVTAAAREPASLCDLLVSSQVNVLGLYAMRLRADLLRDFVRPCFTDEQLAPLLAHVNTQQLNPLGLAIRIGYMVAPSGRGRRSVPALLRDGLSRAAREALTLDTVRALLALGTPVCVRLSHLTASYDLYQSLGRRIGGYVSERAYRDLTNVGQPLHAALEANLPDVVEALMAAMQPADYYMSSKKIQQTFPAEFANYDDCQRTNFNPLDFLIVAAADIVRQNAGNPALLAAFREVAPDMMILVNSIYSDEELELPADGPDQVVVNTAGLEVDHIQRLVGALAAGMRASLERAFAQVTGVVPTATDPDADLDLHLADLENRRFFPAYQAPDAGLWRAAGDVTGLHMPPEHLLDSDDAVFILRNAIRLRDRVDRETRNPDSKFGRPVLVPFHQSSDHVNVVLRQRRELLREIARLDALAGSEPGAAAAAAAAGPGSSHMAAVLRKTDLRRLNYSLGLALDEEDMLLAGGAPGDHAAAGSSQLDRQSVLRIAVADLINDTLENLADLRAHVFIDTMRRMGRLLALLTGRFGLSATFKVQFAPGQRKRVHQGGFDDPAVLAVSTATQFHQANLANFAPAGLVDVLLADLTGPRLLAEIRARSGLEAELAEQPLLATFAGALADMGAEHLATTCQAPGSQEEASAAASTAASAAADEAGSPSPGSAPPVAFKYPTARADVAPLRLAFKAGDRIVRGEHMEAIYRGFFEAVLAGDLPRVADLTDSKRHGDRVALVHCHLVDSVMSNPLMLAVCHLADPAPMLGLLLRRLAQQYRPHVSKAAVQLLRSGAVDPGAGRSSRVNNLALLASAGGSRYDSDGDLFDSDDADESDSYGDSDSADNEDSIFLDLEAALLAQQDLLAAPAALTKAEAARQAFSRAALANRAAQRSMRDSAGGEPAAGPGPGPGKRPAKGHLPYCPVHPVELLDNVEGMCLVTHRRAGHTDAQLAAVLRLADDLIPHARHHYYNWYYQRGANRRLHPADSAGLPDMRDCLLDGRRAEDPRLDGHVQQFLRGRHLSASTGMDPRPSHVVPLTLMHMVLFQAAGLGDESQALALLLALLNGLQLVDDYAVRLATLAAAAQGHAAFQAPLFQLGERMMANMWRGYRQPVALPLDMAIAMGLPRSLLLTMLRRFGGGLHLSMVPLPADLPTASTRRHTVLTRHTETGLFAPRAAGGEGLRSSGPNMSMLVQLTGGPSSFTDAGSSATEEGTLVSRLGDFHHPLGFIAPPVRALLAGHVDLARWLACDPAPRQAFLDFWHRAVSRVPVGQACARALADPAAAALLVPASERSVLRGLAREMFFEPEPLLRSLFRLDTVLKVPPMCRHGYYANTSPGNFTQYMTAPAALAMADNGPGLHTLRGILADDPAYGLTPGQVADLGAVGWYSGTDLAPNSVLHQTRPLYWQHVEVPTRPVSTRQVAQAPLAMAAALGHARATEALLRDFAADPLAADPVTGWTPLHFAAHQHQPVAVRLLLEAIAGGAGPAGGSPGQRLREALFDRRCLLAGLTPVHLAAQEDAHAVLGEMAMALARADAGAGADADAGSAAEPMPVSPARLLLARAELLHPDRQSAAGDGALQLALRAGHLLLAVDIVLDLALARFGAAPLAAAAAGHHLSAADQEDALARLAGDFFELLERRAAAAAAATATAGDDDHHQAPASPEADARFDWALLRRAALGENAFGLSAADQVFILHRELLGASDSSSEVFHPEALACGALTRALGVVAPAAKPALPRSPVQGPLPAAVATPAGPQYVTNSARCFVPLLDLMVLLSRAPAGHPGSPVPRGVLSAARVRETLFAVADRTMQHLEMLPSNRHFRNPYSYDYSSGRGNAPRREHVKPEGYPYPEKVQIISTKNQPDFFTNRALLVDVAAE
ncbi:hypothetical protein H696_00014 [Fonticula alba]|uniref:Uncharacterized protein n=1 Tax=Fonticula alba TaxID=691883 RepID=A0A058ZES9_FONAL|nr:hypothetical protein H696_00014 [Fonticula alba]KCV72428.1 hypothetical protein H696_00014 [Fonticula alba]|eukprot:XP_009492129.1 hypothetical protein H696_00014 [Fonticula alba]